jgi:hypothetical protein
MRRVTIFWFLIAGCLGVALFLVKYEVQDREEQLASLHREILSNQEAVHVLEAEWSYLNRPSRLEALVRRHLDLVPLDATQLGQLDLLPMRLDDLGNAGGAIVGAAIMDSPITGTGRAGAPVSGTGISGTSVSGTGNTDARIVGLGEAAAPVPLARPIRISSGSVQ